MRTIIFIPRKRTSVVLSLIILIFFCTASDLFAQRELNYIAIDSTVLDFSSGTVKTFGIPKINSVAYRYMSTISTPGGRLALISICTLGPTSFSILDRKGNIMPHGAVPLDAECNLVVPNPCDTNIYYVFVQTENSGDGLAYVTVDLRKNGGLGDVVSSPVTLILRELADNIFATPMADGKGYWVMVHDYVPDRPSSLDPTYGFNYFAYKVTADGVDPTPVISLSSYSGPSTDDEWPSSISPDGKTIFYPNAYLPRNDIPIGGELMTLNPATGQITHRQIIPFAAQGINANYGSAFSPDGTKLYISPDGPNDLGEIIQVDLSSGDSATIVNSTTVISHEAGRLIRGTDGKMYVYATIANPRDVSTDIKVIESPNVAGTACNYHAGFLDLHRNMWNAATVEEVSQFVPFTGSSPASFWSSRIISDSNNITLHLPIFFRHSGTMSDVSLIMHYPTKGTLKFLGTTLYNGKSFDVAAGQWPGRVALQLTASDLNGAPDSLLGSVNFLWTPYEYDCDQIIFDSLQTVESACQESGLSSFEGYIGSYSTCGINAVAENFSQRPAFSIFPNPAGASIEVKMTNTGHPLRYELFDALGITQKTGTIGGNSFKLTISEFPNGKYYLRIVNPNGYPTTMPFVIAK